MGKKNNPDYYKAWFLVVTSLVAICFGFQKKTDSTSITSATQIAVELYDDMKNGHLVKGSVDYKFWTKEYKAEFVILKGSISSGRHMEVSELKKGQKVQLQIKKSDVNRLSSEQNRIKVYGIAVKGKPLFTINEFIINRKNYAWRIKIFFFLIGGIGLWRGIVLIKKQG